MLRRHKEMKPEKDGQDCVEEMPMYDRRHLHMMKRRPAMRRHPMMGRHPGMGHMRFPGRRMDLLEEIEDKEEALEHMDYRKKMLAKQRRRLMKRIEKLDILDELFDQSTKEIAQLEEYSPEDMRKILRRAHREFEKKTVDLDI